MRRSKRTPNFRICWWSFYLGRRMSRNEYPLFEKLLTEIKSHLDKWWTVTEMAELCNLSDDQLRRLFIKYTGGKPKLYVDRLKLRRAGELLTTGNLKISEIAVMLGYLDQYHFSASRKSWAFPAAVPESLPNAINYSDAERRSEKNVPELVLMFLPQRCYIDARRLFPRHARTGP